ncbi:hypothetical protein ACFO9E_25240 [Streptomyces maoxianensis]|uniref:Uncharacterized protein n=1 Tax=Streptomyces maoxianensis TaxID=1459942 RepID=A0ABV9G9V7_9ACTN
MTDSNILVVDAGSSSLHLMVLDEDNRELAAENLTEPPSRKAASAVSTRPRTWAR